MERKRIHELRSVDGLNDCQRMTVEMAAERCGLIGDVQRLLRACQTPGGTRIEMRTVVNGTNRSWILENGTERDADSPQGPIRSIWVVLAGRCATKGTNLYVPLDAEIAFVPEEDTDGLERPEAIWADASALDDETIDECLAELAGRTQ